MGSTLFSLADTASTNAFLSCGVGICFSLLGGRRRTEGFEQYSGARVVTLVGDGTVQGRKLGISDICGSLPTLAFSGT